MWLCTPNLCYCSLNPYSNGMKIEQASDIADFLGDSRLNPYSNGMKIEKDI